MMIAGPVSTTGGVGAFAAGNDDDGTGDAARSSFLVFELLRKLSFRENLVLNAAIDGFEGPARFFRDTAVGSIVEGG